MPVGNSDRGVGLWAGQVMFGLDNINEHIDWWHEAIPGSGESFAHEGTLTSTIAIPSITIGLTNYINVSVSPMIGYRYMGWDGDTTTIHHRDEGTDTRYKNAIGGLLGNTKIECRYLALNDGQGPGKRLFLGGGISLPSKNTITSDPFFLQNKEKMTDHRHFSMSDGCIKIISEIQYYKKRNKTPVFIGGSFLFEAPLKENKYGYKSPMLYDFIATAFSKEKPSIKGSVGLSVGLKHTSSAYWNKIKAPNSKSTIFTTGIGTLKNYDFGTISLFILKPWFVNNVNPGIEAEESDLNQKVGSWQVSIGFRHIFDFVIPWLDPLKGL